MKTTLKDCTVTGPSIAAAFMACGLALLAASCASPHIERLTQRPTDSPLIGDLLNAERLTPVTQAFLEERGLAAAYRSDPAETIGRLHEGLVPGGSGEQRLAVVELCSNQGDRLAEEQPRLAVGYHLAAAELAFESALDAAGNAAVASDPLAMAYNNSAGRVVKILFDTGHSWTEAASFEGPWKSYRMRLRSGGDSSVDPTYYDDIEPADYIEYKDYEVERFRQQGVGEVMIAHRNGTRERRQVNPFLSPAGLTLPVNAMVNFHAGGDQVELVLTDLLLQDESVVRGRALPLASDLTTPLLVQVDYDVDRQGGFKAMTHPDDYLEHTGLYLLEPFRRDQIPVVFVHGLMSSPHVWLDALNQLRADPELRRRYQLLVFRYPTGYPIIYNVASLRKRLAEFQQRHDPGRRNADMRNMIVIGHSMGGILSNSQIRGSGDVFTDYLFTRPIDEIDDLDAEQKAALKDLLIYEANPDITRAVFVAAPHRGADMAGATIGSLGRKLIKIPGEFIVNQQLQEIDGLTEEGRAVVAGRPDGVGGLKPDAPVLECILANPVREGVTVHSVIGRHDPSEPLEQSSDKLVPYRSSHLDEAVSEKVLHATHTSICHQAEAIEEVRRILYLHAGLKDSR